MTVSDDAAASSLRNGLKGERSLARRPCHGLGRTRRRTTSRHRSTTSTTYRTSAMHTPRWPATSMARFKRLDGFDVKFLTGTDEHGQKNEKAAQAIAGIEPRRPSSDKLSERKFPPPGQSAYERTPTMTSSAPLKSAPQTRRARRSGKRLVENDQIYLGTYAGWYAVRDEAYYTARSELSDGPDGKKVAPSVRRPSGWKSQSYFFQAVRMAGPVAGLLPGQPRLHRCRRDPPQRNGQLHQRAACSDLSVSPDHLFKWGDAGPRRSRPCHVRVDRRAHQLHHGRLVIRTWKAQAIYKIYWPANPSTWWVRISCGSTRSTGRPS